MYWGRAMSPQRVQMSRRHPWRADHPDAIIVARPSRWGNPYAVGVLIRDFAAECVRDGKDPVALRAFAPAIVTRPDPPDWMIVRTVRDRADAVECFRHLMREYRFNDEDTFEEWLDPLVGRDLACWCPLVDEHGERAPCHADVLLEIANGGAR